MCVPACMGAVMGAPSAACMRAHSPRPCTPLALIGGHGRGLRPGSVALVGTSAAVWCVWRGVPAKTPAVACAVLIPCVLWASVC